MDNANNKKVRDFLNVFGLHSKDLTNEQREVLNGLVLGNNDRPHLHNSTLRLSDIEWHDNGSEALENVAIFGIQPLLELNEIFYEAIEEYLDSNSVEARRFSFIQGQLTTSLEDINDTLYRFFYSILGRGPERPERGG